MVLEIQLPVYCCICRGAVEGSYAGMGLGVGHGGLDRCENCWAQGIQSAHERACRYFMRGADQLSAFSLRGSGGAGITTIVERPGLNGEDDRDTDYFKGLVDGIDTRGEKASKPSSRKEQLFSGYGRPTQARKK